MSRAAAYSVVMALFAATPAAASDFSKLSEPGFARMLLIDPVRAEEAQCATAGLANARLGRGAFKEAAALEMAGVVVERLSIELGTKEEAEELVMDRVASWSPQEWEEADDRNRKLEALTVVADACRPLYESYQQGGLAGFKARLRPQGPLIPLLPLGDCVAIAEASVNIENSLFDKDQLEELTEMLAKLMDAGERASHLAAVVEARAQLKAATLDDERLSRRALACYATFRQRLQRDAEPR